MNQRTKDEVERLRSIASSLSYNNDKMEGDLKHTLYEVAMRLDTSWYEQSDDFKPLTIPKVWDIPVCNHPEHNFPMMFYIPPGQSYTHVCPNCGYRITIAGEPISL
ncbi:MAG TPA: hypothetical protein VFM18_20275 [Methanosarcina sp.]|nr:hypothetical protein [Methanosarcina sp.]